MELEGKRVVLTGAASGIGKALRQRLTRKHCQIVAADIQTLDVSDAPSVHAFTGDMGDPAVVDRLFDEAHRLMGSIDIFIANAGFTYYGPIGEPDWDRIEAIYRVNVFSPLYAAQKMAQVDHPYTVVMMASAMAYLGLPGYAIYGSTKAALHRFADAYRYEMPSQGRLMLVYPISTRTTFFDRAGTSPLIPSQTPDYVARRIVAGLEKNRTAVHPSPGFQMHRFTSCFTTLFDTLYQQYAARALRKSYLVKQ